MKLNKKRNEEGNNGWKFIQNREEMRIRKIQQLKSFAKLLSPPTLTKRKRAIDDLFQ